MLTPELLSEAQATSGRLMRRIIRNYHEKQEDEKQEEDIYPFLKKAALVDLVSAFRPSAEELRILGKLL